MEVKPGYKQTEVGVIPEDWNTTAIRDITIKIGSGITPTGGSKRYHDYGRPFVRSQNVGWGTFKLDDLVFIDDETHNEFSGTELRKQDVLLNITGASIGRTTMVDDRLVGGNVNQHVCIIRADKDKVVPKIINLLLLYSLGQNQIENFQAGGNRQGLNFNQIGSIRIPLPPTLTEQTAIATALSDADALIQSLERLIAKKRDIRQGAMQELLTGKMRLPGFEKKKGYKQTEVGVIPEDWGVKRLGDISYINMGQSPDSEFYSQSGNGLPLIQGNADIKERKTIQRVWTTHITKTCDVGDILLTVRAPVGSVGIASENSCVGRGVCSLKPIDIDKSYLFFILMFSEGRWKSLEQGSTFTAANSTQIADFPLIISPINAEQSAIAAVLSDMDAEIAALESKLAKARQIKQGMMQELLTGRIRLT